jgi:hypothetical protein
VSADPARAWRRGILSKWNEIAAREHFKNLSRNRNPKKS